MVIVLLFARRPAFLLVIGRRLRSRVLWEIGGWNESGIGSECKSRNRIRCNGSAYATCGSPVVKALTRQ
jgi:hypothetical protein